MCHFWTRFFQFVISADRTFAAGASDGQFHSQNRDGQDNQKDQVEKHEYAAAVVSGDIRKTPDVADADGTAGSDQ